MVDPEATQLEIDIVCAVARIRQYDEHGWPDILTRLVESDVPRLLNHVRPEVVAWADKVANSG